MIKDFIAEFITVVKNIRNDIAHNGAMYELDDAFI
jgi:hypothetical protein